MRLAMEVPVTSTPEASGGKSQHFGRPGDDLTLHLYRCVVAAAEICVQAAGQ